MAKLDSPPTQEEISRFEKHVAELSGWADNSKAVYWWMFDLEEMVALYRIEHLPNPFVVMIKKEDKCE